MISFDNDIVFLTQLSYRLNDLSDYDSIKDIALPMIQQYTLAPYAHFSLYDPIKRTLKVSHIQAESTLINSIIEHTGKKIFSTLTPVDERAYELIVSSDVTFLTSLTDLSFGEIPPILDQAIKKLTGFYWFCSIPQIDQGKLFGVTVLAFKKHQKLPSSIFLKSYSCILSLALRKKDSEEKLQEKELMLQHLTDSMGEVFWMRNKDNNQIYYINHAYEKIWGRSCQSLCDNPDSFLDALHPEDKGKVMEAYGNFQNPYGLSLEYRIVRPDNEIRWINARAYNIKDKLNHIHAYAGFAIDITERKKNESLLVEYANTQEFLLGLATRYINIKPDEIQQAVQNALAELGSFLGIDRAYIFSYYWEKQECSNTYEWCAESIPSVIQDLQNLPFSLAQDIVDAHSKGAFYLLEDLDLLSQENPMKEFFKQQGIQSMITIPFFQQNQCSGFIGFDSVKQKHTYSDKEKKLLKLFTEMIGNLLEKSNLAEKIDCEATKFNKLFYANPALMAISDINNQRYLEVNDTFLDVLGYTREEVIGKTPDELEIFVCPEQVKHAVTELRKSGKMLNIEMNVQSKKGELLTGLFSGDSIEMNGTKTFLSVMIDISVQKRMETLKQQLIEKLSHELRTPLSSLKQAFGIIGDKSDDSDLDLHDIVKRNILRMEGLLDKIIDFNVLNQDNVSFLRAKTLLSDLLNEVKGKMTQLNPSITINLSIEDAHASLFLDQHMIKKILEEIIQNAITHGSASTIHMETHSTPAYHQIVISDSGRGIPKEDLKNVFDPFFQSKEEYQTKRGKAGLGLSVAKKIVEAHGGTLSIQSSAGKGTIVSIALPVIVCHIEE